MQLRSLDARQTADLLDVCRGKAPADVVIRQGRVIDVYSEETTPGDIAVKHGRIAQVGGDAAATVGDSTHIFDADNAFVLPGYIEPHCHPWALYNPDTLARAVLPLGNTALVGELLNLQLVLPADAVKGIYRDLQKSPMRWLWAVRVAGQSAQPLDGPFSLNSIEKLLGEDGVVQIAEVTSWPQILAADPDLLERLALAGRFGVRLDGHTAGATSPKVGALAAAGFTADHESITADEVRERLRNGYHVFLRHSSLRPDLDEFIPLLQAGTGASRMSLTTDGSGPSWLQEHGMIDGLVRRVIREGVPRERAVALATLNPATYFRLDESIGGLAPRRHADIQVLEDFDGRPPRGVFIGGDLVAQDGELCAEWPTWDLSALGVEHSVDLTATSDPTSYESPMAPGEHGPAMNFVSAGIARASEVTAGADGWPPDGVLCVLFSRDGRRRAWAWLTGFAPRLEGMASTYTTSGDFLVIGRDPHSMATAARKAFRRGGIVVVEGGEVAGEVDLPIAQSMSRKPLDAVAEEWKNVEAAVRRAGYKFEELLYCLCFITCDFLPDLRLIPAGLLEVKTGRIIMPGTTLERH